MKRKGFTLVELLAVIVIMAVIMTIGYYGTKGVSSSIKNQMWKSQKKLIESSAVKFGEDNKVHLTGTCQVPNEDGTGMVEKDNCKIIDVNTLLKRDYIRSKENCEKDGNKYSCIMDNNGEEVNTQKIVVYIENNNVYSSVGTCSEGTWELDNTTCSNDGYRYNVKINTCTGEIKRVEDKSTSCTSPIKVTETGTCDNGMQTDIIRANVGGVLTQVDTSTHVCNSIPATTIEIDDTSLNDYNKVYLNLTANDDTAIVAYSFTTTPSAAINWTSIPSQKNWQDRKEITKNDVWYFKVKDNTNKESDWISATVSTIDDKSPVYVSGGKELQTIEDNSCQVSLSSAAIYNDRNYNNDETNSEGVTVYYHFSTTDNAPSKKTFTKNTSLKVSNSTCGKTYYVWSMAKDKWGNESEITYLDSIYSGNSCNKGTWELNRNQCYSGGWRREERYNECLGKKEIRYYPDTSVSEACNYTTCGSYGSCSGGEKKKECKKYNGGNLIKSYYEYSTDGCYVPTPTPDPDPEPEPSKPERSESSDAAGPSSSPSYYGFTSGTCSKNYYYDHPCENVSASGCDKVNKYHCRGCYVGTYKGSWCYK